MDIGVFCLLQIVLMEQFDFDQSVKDTASFARDKVDNILYRSTDTLGKTLGKIAVIAGVSFLLIIIFIFLNITLAVLISQWIGCNYCWGFLIVALFYLLVLLVLWLLSPVIKATIYKNVASFALSKISDINKQVNDNLPDNLKRDAYETERINRIVSQNTDRNTVNTLIEHTERKCERGEIVFKNNLSYVKTHFKSILLTMSKNKAIGVLSKNKYIGFGLGLIDSIKNKSKKKIETPKTYSYQQPNNSKTNNKGLIVGGMTVLTILSPFIKSFLWGLAISKAKRMILNRILPFRKKKRK